MAEKLVIMVTHGPESPERATIPFVMATAAQASDVEVVMGFQADGVMLVKKGVEVPVYVGRGQIAQKLLPCMSVYQKRFVGYLFTNRIHVHIKLVNYLTAIFNQGGNLDYSVFAGVGPACLKIKP